MRRKLTAIVIAVLVFGLISASAASLGGINTDADLGADTNTIAACDAGDGVVASFSDPQYVGGILVIDDVTISDLENDCQGDDITVTLAESDGTEIATVTGVVASDADDNNATTLTGFAADANLTEEIHVLVTDA